MPQHNWDKIIENLKNHPGEEFLVAELISNGYADKRMRDAGMAIRQERVTSKLYNLYAHCPEPTSQLNFDAIESHERQTLEARIDAAHSAAVTAEEDYHSAQQLLQERYAHHQTTQATLKSLLAELKALDELTKEHE